MFFLRGAAREPTPKCDDCGKILKKWKSETMARISSMCAPFISVEKRLKLFGISRDDDYELTFFYLYHCWFPVVFMILMIVSIVTNFIFSKYACMCIGIIMLLVVSPFCRQDY